MPSFTVDPARLAGGEAASLAPGEGDDAGEADGEGLLPPPQAAARTTLNRIAPGNLRAFRRSYDFTG
jgi:hypothetical protein